MEVHTQIGTGETAPTPTGSGIVITTRITVRASVPVGHRSPWQRKCRDTQHSYDQLVDAHRGPGVHDDDFTRRIESFSKLAENSLIGLIRN